MIIGADEVGRGCLAGPLCVGAVMVPEDMTCPRGVTDSKKLSTKKREAVLQGLKDVSIAVVFVEAADIDRDGIMSCLRRAFRETVQALLDKGETVSRILIDGNPMPLVFGDVPVEFIVRGDASDWRIGAASIAAKVTRDHLMVEESQEHPGYGFEVHKGYGTPHHIQAIQRQGLCPLHRASFCTRFLPQPDVLDFFR